MCETKRTPLPEDAFAMSPFPLSWHLTVKMHPQLLMNRTKIHMDMHRLLHHRGRLYRP